MSYLIIFLIQFFLLFLLSRALSRSISSFAFRLTKNVERSIRLFHFIFLPGVLVHELSHMISAEVMFVHTHGLNLTPIRIGNQLTMGSVQIEKTDPVRRAIIGFAPVLVGFLIISVTTFYFLSENSPFSLYISYLFIFIIVFEVGNTMFSSRRDLEGTVELIIFLILLIGLLLIFGFDFHHIINFLDSGEIQDILIKGIKLLMIPIVIDVVIVLISRFFQVDNA